MAYEVQLDEVTVLPYLESLDLSAEGQNALLRVLDQVRYLDDATLGDRSCRLEHESDCFRLELLFRDVPRKRIHALNLVISDAAAPYGVLRVLFAEDIAGPIR